MELKTKVKIVDNFGTKGAWEKQFVGVTGTVGSRGESNTCRVDLPTGGCLFVEEAALEALS